LRLTGTGVAPNWVEVDGMLADEVDFVIGVDTHRDEHALALVACPSGACLGEAVIAAEERGYAAALALAAERASGERAWAVEGTGSYGKGLTRYLLQRGERVLEVERPRRQRRRGGAKSDRLDALAAARSLIAEEKPALPRAAGCSESLRVLLTVRQSAVDARRVALNQLRALLVTCPEPLRAELASLTRARLLRRCRELAPEREPDPELAGTLLALRLLAARIEALAAEEKHLDKQILSRTKEAAAQLLAERGVGPIGAAQLLVSWSHRGRLRSEAAFARLAGAPPIPASSGQTIRYRLDRGGDRKLNSVLHRIVIERRKRDARTIAYIDRRRQEGKTEREAIRCLKRYLARHLFRLMENTTTA
jgi:transposase